MGLNCIKIVKKQNYADWVLKKLFKQKLLIMAIFQNQNGSKQHGLNHGIMTYR